MKIFIITVEFVFEMHERKNPFKYSVHITACINDVHCSSRKYPYHPSRSLEIPKGRGGDFQKLKFLKESLMLNWNFQSGGGVQPKKTFHGRGFGFFLEQHNIIRHCTFN